MEIGIDTFAGIDPNSKEPYKEQAGRSMQNLLERIILADEAGLHAFGIGEHYRREYMDSANTVILGAAAAITERIRLTSAVTVLSASDPVRVFQQFSTLDLISGGRAEMIAGRGSFTDSFPLFGLNMNDYDDLFSEKLELLLKIFQEEKITWSGKYRPPLKDQPIYPRPLQEPFPISIGVGGTPASFIRAGRMGLPLTVAVIGGQTERFRQLVELYYEAAENAGHPKERLRVNLHSLGFVAQDGKKARDDYYPGYAEMFNRIGKERGWSPVRRDHFEWQTDQKGALVVGEPEEVAEKILRHSEALGGINRFTFQMDNARLTNHQVMEAIELIGREVIPRINT